jgi:hypothetical protein
VFESRVRLQHWLEHVAPTSPLPLALLRILLGALVWFSPEPQVARGLAQHLMNGREALLFAPEGLDWMIPVLRACAPYLDAIHWVLRVTAVTCSLGLMTRVSLALLLASTFILFGAAQFTGTVTHDMQLLWMMALLLAGPREQGLSVDTWMRKRSQLRPLASHRATFTLWGARLLLGCVYLFPGIAKLRVSGLEWAFGDNLVNQMRLKWFMADAVPWPRIDLWPGLLHASGVCVLLFEVGFILLIWSRWGRRVAVATGLLFHWAMAHFLYVHFVGLWGCYVVFWDGPSAPVAPASEHQARTWWPLLVTAALAIPTVVQGVRGQTQSWPFACFPDFARAPAAHITDIALDVQLTDGTWRTLRPPRKRAPQAWGTIWRMLGLYSGAPERTALDAYAHRWLSRAPARDEVAQPNHFRFYAEEYSVVPEDYSRPPRRRRLVAETNFSK